MMSYDFKGYWRDVGTIESLWEANMDLLSENPEFDLYDVNWKIFSVNPTSPPHLVAPSGKIKRSLVSVGLPDIRRGGKLGTVRRGSG